MGPWTSPLHFDLSCACLVASVHVLNPSCFPSFYTVLLHVSFSLPLFIFPSGAQSSAVLVFLLLSILRTCPIHCHLLFFTIVLIFSSPALFLASVLVIFSGQYIFRMLLMHLWRKVPKIFSSPSVIFQVSLPYNRTDRTFDLRSFILVFLPNWLLFHTDTVQVFKKNLQ